MSIHCSKMCHLAKALCIDLLILALDPCSTSPAPCESPMICVPSQENYTCTCPAGFHDPTCSDINECRNYSHNCGSYTSCKNTIGGYFCECISSYRRGNETFFYPTNNKIENYCTDYNKCHSQSTADLEDCEKFNRQDALCSLLKSNARTQEDSCNTNIYVQDVALQITKILNQTSLTNLTFLDLRKSVTAIFETVEISLLASFTKDLKNHHISNLELEVEMKASQDICGGASSLTLVSLGNTIDVPCSLVSREKHGAILILYKDLDPRLGSVLGALRDSDHEGTAEIISQVVSGAITSPNTENLDHPVTFYLKHLKDLKPSFVFQCVFWNTTQKGWSSDGCYTKPSDNVNSTLCVCYHLSTFAVLMAPGEIQVLCSVIAGTLQFLFLCDFCWMSLESILLFLTVRNLQKLNYMTSQHSHFPYVCVVGFGIPLIVLVITAVTPPDGYGNDELCWLDHSLVWSFLGPVCGFIVVNFILLVLTFGLLKKKLASLNSNVSTLKHTRLLTFKALSQLFILGCTWIIGLFQFGSGSLIISYIFTICNSLQGAYILLVHCLLNRQVREEYSRDFCRLWSKKSESEATSGTPMPIIMESSQAYEAPKPNVLSREDIREGSE